MNSRAIRDAAERGRRDRWEPSSADETSDDILFASPQRPRKRNREYVETSSSAPSAATTMKTWFLWTHNSARPATGNPDIRLATVGIDKSRQDSIISLRHARLLKLMPSSTDQESSGAVEDIQDFSIEVAWVGKSQEGGILKCKVSIDARHDIILGVDFLSLHASALFNDRPRKAPTEIGRSLDTLFRPVDPNKRRNFFKRGIVIRVLWPQPHPHDGNSGEGVFKVHGWTEKIHYKITWFVVVQVFKAHCIALPIHTYGGQGTTKPGVESSNHAALMLEGDEQKLLSGEVLTKDSFRMIAEAAIDLDQASRIDFSKPSTIEYNIKVMKVGRIISKDVGRLLDYFQRTLSKNDTNPLSVPYPRNVDFFGREEQLDQLSNSLVPSKQQAFSKDEGIAFSKPLVDNDTSDDNEMAAMEPGGTLTLTRRLGSADVAAKYPCPLCTKYDGEHAFRRHGHLWQHLRILHKLDGKGIKSIESLASHRTITTTNAIENTTGAITQSTPIPHDNTSSPFLDMRNNTPSPSLVSLSGFLLMKGSRTKYIGA
ncbi:hypothetical protein F4860DRAFT_529776 [Xylaria cubensis]|nr:hypothetical protein F4860DRAFT_529776 [Xylaria cubensis]